MTPPRLETDRLILRGRRLDDFPAIAAMLADPAVTAHLGFAPLARDEAWMRFARAAGMWALVGYGPFLVEEKSTGAVVGDIGPGDFKRAASPGPEPPEFSWIVAPRFQGRGYASEALAVSIDWMAQTAPGRAFSCIIEPSNVASLRLAEKGGFRDVARVVDRGAELILLRRAPA